MQKNKIYDLIKILNNNKNKYMITKGIISMILITNILGGTNVKHTISKPTITRPSNEQVKPLEWNTTTVITTEAIPGLNCIKNNNKNVNKITYKCTILKKKNKKYLQ